MSALLQNLTLSHVKCASSSNGVQRAGESTRSPFVSGGSIVSRARAARLTTTIHTAVCNSANEGLKNSPSSLSRRTVGAVIAALVATGAQASSATADEAEVEVLSEVPGVGQTTIRKNSLVLLHYVGTVNSNGEVFDTTRGGRYLNGGEGAFRPAIVRVSGDPQPGIVEGLQKGLLGMTVGGKKTYTFPASLGFGSSSVKAPFGIVPTDSALTYEVEILRVSNSGPDELMKYISNCGTGGAGAQDAGCADIVPM